MGRTFTIVCHDCKVYTCVGQNSAGSPAPWLYEPQISEFLFAHQYFNDNEEGSPNKRRHRLEFGDSEWIVSDVIPYDPDLHMREYRDLDDDDEERRSSDGN